MPPFIQLYNQWVDLPAQALGGAGGVLDDAADRAGKPLWIRRACRKKSEARKNQD